MKRSRWSSLIKGLHATSGCGIWRVGTVGRISDLKKQGASEKKLLGARGVARRAAILKAGDNLVREAILGGTTSIDSISTTRIAEAANISVGSVYQYFRDKNEILDCLYTAAYGEVEAEVYEKQLSISHGALFEETIFNLLQHFWRVAREHPTFRALTRWSNGQRSLRDATPGMDSGLATIVRRTLEQAHINIGSEDHYSVAVRTVTITISALADQAIEENDEALAAALIDELCVLICAYLGRYT